tara:strand:+ start:691 stop:1119 length:429 start_codon:yes stop_codon:yes gene_type:complete
MSEEIIKTLLSIMTPEQKAELISKLQDPDLPIENTAYVQEEQVKPPKNTSVDVDDFTMTKDKANPNSTQVEVKKRVNLFSDDGTEHKDPLNKTPEVTPTERKRPPIKNVSQTCSSCGKSLEVHPAHKRENFICDKCLRSRSV